MITATTAFVIGFIIGTISVATLAFLCLVFYFYGDELKKHVMIYAVSKDLKKAKQEKEKNE